jgi:hypothetical protein
LENVADTSFRSLLALALLRARQALQHDLDECRFAGCVMLLRPVLKIEDRVSNAVGGSLLSLQQDPPHFVTYRVNGPRPSDPTTYFKDAIDSWRRSTMMMAAMAEESEGTFAAVLLPSPWSHPSQADPPNSTPEERSYYRPRSEPLHGIMERTLPVLRAAGVRTIDAGHTLDRSALTDPTVYLDGHGHLGPVGARALLDLTITQLLGMTFP